MNFDLIHNNDLSVLLEFKNRQEAAVDLTGAKEVVFILKKTVTGDEVIRKTLDDGITINSPTSDGIVTIVFTQDDTDPDDLPAGCYLSDAYAIDASDKKHNARTFDYKYGQVNVLTELEQE